MKKTDAGNVPDGLQLWMKQQQTVSQVIVKQQVQLINQLFDELAEDKAIPIESDEDYQFFGELLKHSLGELKEVKKNKEAVTKPINAALRAFQSWHQPPIKAWEAVINLIKQKMGEYDRRKLELREAAALKLAQAAEEGDFEAAMEASQDLAEETPEIEGLSNKEVWVPDLERVDLSKVPVPYLALDMDAVKHYLKEFEKKKENPVDLPGLPFKREIRVNQVGGKRK